MSYSGHLMQLVYSTAPANRLGQWYLVGAHRMNHCECMWVSERESDEYCHWRNQTSLWRRKMGSICLRRHKKQVLWHCLLSRAYKLYGSHRLFPVSQWLLKLPVHMQWGWCAYSGKTDIVSTVLLLMPLRELYCISSCHWISFKAMWQPLTESKGI